MSVFREEVEISNPSNPKRSLKLEMIVDSGATCSWLPVEILLKLGITPVVKREFKLANGTIVEKDVGIINITINQETLPTLCVFGDSQSEPLLGAMTLEEFSLGIDPVNKRLLPKISYALVNIASLIEVKPNPNIPALAPGDTVKVSAKIIEAGRERTQLFQGVVIKVGHNAQGGNFTVRRVAYGVGVERTFPLYSPLVEKVEVVRHGKVRRAKLYYLRGLSAKASRLKEKRIDKERKPRQG